MPEFEIPENEARPVTCDCGEEFFLNSPEEDAHYVWAMRRDGSRSNLGYCPVKHGMSVAISKARASLTGTSMYHGNVV